MGFLRFCLLAMFTLALAVVTGRTHRLSYEGTNLSVAQYPTHILIVLWTAVVGVLWLRLQEMSEAPSISPVRVSRRIVLAAIVLISAIPPPMIVDTLNARPLLVTEILSLTLIGLVLWQHIVPPRHIHRLSDGLESLVVLVSAQVILAVAGTVNMFAQNFVLEAISASALVACAMSIGMAVSAYRKNRGRGHATTTLYLVAAEILAYLAYPVAASMVRRS